MDRIKEQLLEQGMFFSEEDLENASAIHITLTNKEKCIIPIDNIISIDITCLKYRNSVTFPRHVSSETTIIPIDKIAKIVVVQYEDV